MGSDFKQKVLLVHLASGIGNLVLATPLLIALSEMGYTQDLVLHADYEQAGGLFSDWSVLRHVYKGFVSEIRFDDYHAIVPAIPPFYWKRFASFFAGCHRMVQRPPDALFYEDEQAYYMAFARETGYVKERHPCSILPIVPGDAVQVNPWTVVLAPGSKTGEMAAKRWPHFPELAEAMEDVVLIGTSDDLFQFSGSPFNFPGHVRNFIDRLSLRETAELIAAAGAFVGNDSGLSHIAAAVGTPTIMIFGPTPHQSLGQFPDNVRILRNGLACEPCWFNERFQACNAGIQCLNSLGVNSVLKKIREFIDA